MKWTKDKPKVDGWYWYRGSIDASNHARGMTAFVTYIENGTMWQPFMDYADDLSRIEDGEWAGPITPVVENETT